MTTIDQTSSVIAPILTSYILIFGGYRFACVLFILWNFVSWIVERYFLVNVYNQVEELAVRQKISKYFLLIFNNLLTIKKFYLKFLLRHSR